MRRTCPAHRKAFTLIEMLIAITIGSSLMVTSVALLHRSFELHRLAQERTQREQLLARFIQQFRRDVYTAVDVEIRPSSELTLEFVDQNQISYLTQDNQLIRQVSGQKNGRNSIRLGPANFASFELSDDGRRVILIVQHEAALETRITRKVVEVCIGRITTQIALTDGIPVEVPK